MSLAIRTIKVDSHYYLDLSSKDLDINLLGLGFKRNNKGWIPPKGFSFEYDHEGKPLPLNIDRWPERHIVDFEMTHGSMKKLLDFKFEETVEVRYGKYDFLESNKYYIASNINPTKKVYQDLLEAEFLGDDDWFKFPFKARIGLVSFDKALSLERLKRTKGIIGDILSEITDRNSEFRNDAKGFLEGLADKRFTPHVEKNEYGVEQETYEFSTWGQVMLFEIFEDYRNDIKITTCQSCNKPIYLKKPFHKDRKYHTRIEDVSCWRARQSRIKRKQRTSKTVSS